MELYNLMTCYHLQGRVIMSGNLVLNTDLRKSGKNDLTIRNGCSDMSVSSQLPWEA